MTRRVGRFCSFSFDRNALPSDTLCMNTTQTTEAQIATTLDDRRVADHFRTRFGALAYAEAERALPTGRASTRRVLALLK